MKSIIKSTGAILAINLFLVLSPCVQAQTSVAGLPVSDPLTFVEVPFEQIWNDRGSGGDRDVSFWRPRLSTMQSQNLYFLGDYVFDRYSTPPWNGIAVRAANPQNLARPSDFQLIWNDAGSGADLDGSIWRPVCPSGYVAMGDIANRSHQKPDISTTRCRCVKRDLVERSSYLTQYWTDRGSGADRDVSVWTLSNCRIEIPGNEHISISLFAASPSYRQLPAAQAWKFKTCIPERPVRTRPLGVTGGHSTTSGSTPSYTYTCRPENNGVSFIVSGTGFPARSSVTIEPRFNGTFRSPTGNIICGNDRHPNDGRFGPFPVDASGNFETTVLVRFGCQHTCSVRVIVRCSQPGGAIEDRGLDCKCG